MSSTIRICDTPINTHIEQNLSKSLTELMDLAEKLSQKITVQKEVFSEDITKIKALENNFTRIIEQIKLSKTSNDDLLIIVQIAASKFSQLSEYASTLEIKKNWYKHQ